MTKGAKDKETPKSAVRLSVILPALNEAATIETQLLELAPLREEGVEIIVVDGGSADDTRLRAKPHADRVVESPRGRAVQMNAGASVARGNILLFLHADTRLPYSALTDIESAFADPACRWGRFDVTIEGKHPLLPFVASMMNRRSRLTGIATGDQAMFVRRTAFADAGGFPAVALMEDIAVSAALRRYSRPACLRSKVVTSGRRWDNNGFSRTVLLMWCLRSAYALGASPQTLARLYGYK